MADMFKPNTRPSKYELGPKRVKVWRYFQERVGKGALKCRQIATSESSVDFLKMSTGPDSISHVNIRFSAE